MATTTPDGLPPEPDLAPPGDVPPDAEPTDPGVSHDDINATLLPPEVPVSPRPSEPEAPPAPDEVQRDILSQLDTLDAAQAAAAPPAGGYDAGMAGGVPDDPLAFNTAFGLGGAAADYGPDPYAPATASASAPMPGPSPIARLDTLADLYAHYDKLNTGEYVLSVERVKPTSFGGRPCSGWIEDLTSPIDMNGFREQFGGGTYNLSVLGSSGTRMENGGQMAQRTLATLTLSIAGAPVLQDEDMMRGGGRFSVVRGDADVTKTRMELDFKEKERLRNKVDGLTSELIKGRGTNDWEALDRLTESRTEAIERANAEAQGVLRAENQRLREELEHLRVELRSTREEKNREEQRMQNELLSTRQEFILKTQQEETERVRQLKEENERVISRLREDHAGKVERLANDNRQQIKDLSERHERELESINARHERDKRDITDRFERTIERDQADFERRMRDERSEHKRAMDHQEKMYELRLSDAARTGERELRSLRDSLNSQLTSVKLTAETQSGATQQMANQNVNLANMRAEQAEHELERMRAEIAQLNAELRATHKSPVEAVTEAKSLLTTLGVDGKEDEGDWKSQVGAIARNITDKLPELFDGARAVRAQNQAAAVAAAQPPPPRHVAHQHPQAVRRPPPQRAARTAPPGMATGATMHPGGAAVAPVGHSGGHMAPSAVPIGSTAHLAPPQSFAFEDDEGPQVPPMGAVQPPPPPVTAQPDINPPPSPYPPGMGPVPAAPPPPPQAMPPEMAPPMGPPVEAPSPPQAVPQGEPQPETAPVEQPVAEAPPENLELDADTLGMVEEIVSKLEEAIKGNVIGPKAFAHGFVEQIGPEPAARVVLMLSAELFCESVAAERPSSPIATMDGRDYVQKCWDEVKRLTGVA